MTLYKLRSGNDGPTMERFAMWLQRMPRRFGQGFALQSAQRGAWRFALVVLLESDELALFMTGLDEITSEDRSQRCRVLHGTAPYLAVDLDPLFVAVLSVSSAILARRDLVCALESRWSCLGFFRCPALFPVCLFDDDDGLLRWKFFCLLRLHLDYSRPAKDKMTKFACRLTGGLDLTPLNLRQSSIRHCLWSHCQTSPSWLAG